MKKIEVKIHEKELCVKLVIYRNYKLIAWRGYIFGFRDL